MIEAGLRVIPHIDDDEVAGEQLDVVRNGPWIGAVVVWLVL